MYIAQVKEEYIKQENCLPELVLYGALAFFLLLTKAFGGMAI